MAARLPRLFLIVAVGVLATAGLTFAAHSTLTPPAAPASTTPLVQKRAVIAVPDVTNQAFVFAKGALQDAGFAWRVIGSVQGYPSNTVVQQSPAPGARVYDTGAPLVTLRLATNRRYKEKATPQDVSPYRATAIELTDSAAQPLQLQAPKPTTPAAPAPTAPAATTTKPAATPAKPATPAPTKPAPAKPAYPQVRPPAFSVAGASKEPLDELPLVDRAKLLDRWLTTQPKPTSAAVTHWLYQNAWVVTGARFGWWQGADALRILIRVDQRAVALWGIGSKTEAVARGALAEVEARSK